MKSYKLLEMWLSNVCLSRMLYANEHMEVTHVKLLRDPLICDTLAWLRDNWPTDAYSMATKDWIKAFEESEHNVKEQPPELMHG